MPEVAPTRVIFLKRQRIDSYKNNPSQSSLMIHQKCVAVSVPAETLLSAWIFLFCCVRFEPGRRGQLWMLHLQTATNKSYFKNSTLKLALQGKGEVFCDYLVLHHPETNWSAALANKPTNQHTLQHLQTSTTLNRWRNSVHCQFNFKWLV